MVGERKEYALGEIAENVSRPFKFEGRESVVFINTGDVEHGAFLHSKRTSTTGLPGQAKKKILKGDILFSEIRPANGRYAEVIFDADEYVVSTKFMVIRLKNDEIDQQFFLIQLTSKQTLLEFQRIAESRSGTFPQITFDAVSYFPITFPPLPEQKAIAHILGSLDEKIELNRRMNATLEGMAQALFKSWFVDFDPVIDNALAAGNPIPDELADRAEFRRQALANGTANRDAAKHFPANFQQTESMGWIPEGWEVKQVKDFGYVVCGKTPSKSNPDYYGDDVHFIKIPDMHDSVWITNTNDGLSFAGARSQAKKHIPAKSISVSCIATVGKVVITSQPSHTNQQINSLIPHRGESRYYLYFAFLGKNKELHDLASGGSATLNLNTGIFSKIEILSPSQEALSDYHDVIDPLFEKMLASDLESQSLTKLRDTLLPKLISGELQIQEAE